VSGGLKPLARPGSLDGVGVAVRSAPRDGAPKGIRIERVDLG